jgi:SAM-dependent methyltransferase
MCSKIPSTCAMLLILAGSTQSFCPKGISTSRHTLTTPHACSNPVRENDDSIPRRSFLDQATILAGLSASIIVSTPTKAAYGMTTNPKTGTALPDPGEIESSVPTNWSDVENPFESDEIKSMFGRLDSTPDSIFYTDPRFVEHIDENAVQLMTNYISKDATKQGDSVLDLCSSWTSHIEPSVSKELPRVAGLGMNAKELESNTALTDWTVQDLNSNPVLPYKDGEFDVVICQLSIDYLTKPLDVLKDVGRVLKPGGTVHILFSNRLFLSKAVGLWTGADDIDHAYYVGCYLHFSDGGFDKMAARDLSTRKGREKRIAGDPLYVVTAVKAS